MYERSFRLQQGGRVLSVGLRPCSTTGLWQASFEIGGEEGLDIVEEFYADEPKSEQPQQMHDLSHVQDIQKGLQQSVQTLN